MKDNLNPANWFRSAEVTNMDPMMDVCASLISTSNDKASPNKYANAVSPEPPFSLVEGL